MAAFGQAPPDRSLQELINREDPGWPIVLSWAEGATNHYEILPRDSSRASAELFEAQVTTRSPMGAIIYESGGILIDHGWIRILGSGCSRLNRGLMQWNLDKTLLEGKKKGYLLNADDAVGGFFAINAGGIVADKIGTVFYFDPSGLEWISLDGGYSNFVYWCFKGDLQKFYEDLRWPDWKKEIANMSADQTIHFIPPLFTKEGKDVAKSSRRPVPAWEIWGLTFGN